MALLDFLLVNLPKIIDIVKSSGWLYQVVEEMGIK